MCLNTINSPSTSQSYIFYRLRELAQAIPTILVFILRAIPKLSKLLDWDTKWTQRNMCSTAASPSSSRPAYNFKKMTKSNPFCYKNSGWICTWCIKKINKKKNPRTKAYSQWIVTARPLCHLQHLVRLRSYTGDFAPGYVPFRLPRPSDRYSAKQVWASSIDVGRINV